MTSLSTNEIPFLLSALIFLPLLGVVGLFFHRSDSWQRGCGLAGSLVCLPIAWLAWTHFDGGSAAFQFAEHVAWIPWLNTHYTLGTDGISFLMVLLTVGIMPLCHVICWSSIRTRVREFTICLLVMQTAMTGVFCALDAILFFVFWEAMLIPMALMIGIWGGERKEYAAIKFFVYTMAGSVLMLVALVALRIQVGSFHIPDMMAADLPRNFQILVFVAFFLAFAIKVPMFPFHTWLPAAHVQAPTAGSVILASVLLKMGTYGFLRFCLPITPEATHMFAPFLIALSIVAIIYGSLAALAQSDLKRLVAYSSVGHMGFATLGIFCLNEHGIQGAILVMLNHGITTGALFIGVGILYERLHTRELRAVAGVGKHMPAFTALFGLFCLSSLAFPGTNSFLGEFAVMSGAFHVSVYWAIAAVPGIVIVAAYMLRVLQRVAYGGTDNPDHPGLTDIGLREFIVMAPLAVLVLLIGLHPAPVMQLLDASVANLLTQIALP